MAFLLGRVVSTYASAAALSRAAPDNAHRRVMFDLALCTSLHALCGLAALDPLPPSSQEDGGAVAQDGTVTRPNRCVMGISRGQTHDGS